MDVKEIKKLIDLMVKNDLRELEIRDGESRVSLKRGAGEPAPTVALSQVPPMAIPSNVVAEQIPAGESPGQGDEQEFEEIVSPMVGTFYQAASPESDSFVQVGDTVTADTVVCVVEAMKVMNEIKAGLSGTIAKSLVSNGAAVEFGQAMFQVRPA